MIRQIGLYLLFLTLVVGALAQPFDQEGAREKIEAYKIAFITQRLDLTSQEAMSFWPVYNEYNDAIEAYKRDMKHKQRAMRQAFLSANESEITRLVDDYVRSAGEEQNIRLRFHERLKEVLPIRKVVLLYKAEQDLKAQLLREMVKRRQERNQGGRN